MYRGRLIAAVVVVLVLAVVYGIPSVTNEPEPEPVKRTVIYLVRPTEGCGATATFTTPDGTEQHDVRDVETFQPDPIEVGRVVSISAQSDCEYGGVSVRMGGHGEQRYAHSPAGFGVASVSDTVR